MTIPNKSFPYYWEVGGYLIAWAISRFKKSTPTSRIGVRTLQGDPPAVPNQPPRRIQLRPLSPSPVSRPQISRPIDSLAPPSILPSMNPNVPPYMPPDKPLIIESNVIRPKPPQTKKLSPFAIPGIPFWLPALPLATYHHFFSKEQHLYNFDVKITAPPKRTIYQIEVRKANRAFAIAFEVAAGRPLNMLPQSQTHFTSSGQAKSLFNPQENILINAAKTGWVYLKSFCRPLEQLPQRPFSRHTEVKIYVEDPLYDELDPKLRPVEHIIPLSSQEIMRIIHGKGIKDAPQKTQEPPQKVEWDLFSKSTIEVANLVLPFEKQKVQSFNLSAKEDDIEQLSVTQELL